MNIDAKDPIHDETIGSLKTASERVSYLIGDMSVNSKAKFWGIPTSTIAGMLERGTEPTMRNAVKIAAAEGVTLHWLATGEGPMRTEEVSNQRSLNRDSVRLNQSNEMEPLDTYTLQKVIEAVELISDNMDKPLKPERKAKIISVLYDHCIRVDSMDPKFVRQVIDLAS
ncbi:helix-turn-helix domain-containing protein [Aeromonas enteropelogenes]|uniref:helix-turn-helix domain-containing protein n=1 Tax=Aeromonas enteropelogenes TaxID=29489 RepID=UPI003B9FC2CD